MRTHTQAHKRPGLRTILLALALVLGSFAPVRGEAQARVIVPREYKGNDISLEDLVRLYRGDYTQMPTGERVVLAEQASARTLYARRLLSMNDDQFGRHWIRIVFTGRPAAPPKSFSSLEEVSTFVGRTVGAVAIVMGTPNDDVKVLTVNGLAPNDARYPLK